MKLIAVFLIGLIVLSGCTTSTTKGTGYIYSPSYAPEIECNTLESWCGFTCNYYLEDCSDGKEYKAKEYSKQLQEGTE